MFHVSVEREDMVNTSCHKHWRKRIQTHTHHTKQDKCTFRCYIQRTSLSFQYPSKEARKFLEEGEEVCRDKEARVERKEVNNLSTSFKLTAKKSKCLC